VPVHGSTIVHVVLTGEKRQKWGASDDAPRFHGYPRPVVIVQEDRFMKTDSIALYVFTTDCTHAPLLRMFVEPSNHNGLKSASRPMIDKIPKVPTARLGKRLGILNDDDIVRLI
jgi:mRNA interferase MazF